MDPQVKVLATKHDDLNSILCTHKVEERKQISKSCPLHAMACVHAHTIK